MGTLVLLSGGQDSTTALYSTLAVESPENVRALAFNYGQEHASETRAAYKIARGAGVGFECMSVPRLQSGQGPVVPVRNTILLALAANRAIAHGLDAVVIGCCADDAELFPDCRPDFLDLAEQLLELGGTPLRVEAPLVHMSKAQIFRLASDLGVLDVVLEESRTCYVGSDEENVWGHGCAECLACTTRARGWREFCAS